MPVKRSEGNPEVNQLEITFFAKKRALGHVSHMLRELYYAVPVFLQLMGVL